MWDHFWNIFHFGITKNYMITIILIKEDNRDDYNLYTNLQSCIHIR